MAFWDQAGYGLKLEWGPRGAALAAERGEIPVLVDVLSFSSTVTTALHYGARILPCPDRDRLAAFAASRSATALAGRAESAGAGQPCLSPASWGPAHRGGRYALWTANGAVCAQAAGLAPAVLVGCPLNASACAARALALAERHGTAICMVPCGERWPDGAGLRPALEDYMGAGAILAHMEGSLSPEARACRAAWEGLVPDPMAVLADCASARELVEKGYAEDVAHCLRLDVFDQVPWLDSGGAFADASQADPEIQGGR